MADAMILHVKTILVNLSLNKSLFWIEKSKVWGFNNINNNSNLIKENIVKTMTIILLKWAIIAKTQYINGMNLCLCTDISESSQVMYIISLFTLQLVLNR